MVSRRIPRPDDRQFLSDFPNGAAVPASGSGDLKDSFRPELARIRGREQLRSLGPCNASFLDGNQFLPVTRSHLFLRVDETRALAPCWFDVRTPRIVPRAGWEN
jgi:hypothetical protein